MKIKFILSSLSGVTFLGDWNQEVHFVSKEQYLYNVVWLPEEAARKADRGLIITTPQKGLKPIKGLLAYLITDNPRKTVNEVIKILYGKKDKLTRNLAEEVRLIPWIGVGDNVVIEEGCVLGKDIQIGHNTVIRRGTTIGDNCVIGSNCPIGSSGFGYIEEGGKYERMRHIGGVIIRSEVEIGNNVCIDRGTIGDTIIGRGTKIDNLVHVAHNVEIGEDCLITANTTICGSVKIEDNCYVAPSTTIRNKITVEKGSMTGIGSLVVKNVPKETIVMGHPAKHYSRR